MYIGQQPVVGRYIKIDQISGGFNGTASGFTLAAGGQGVLPGTARNLMLSLGGVIQEPEVDFTISGSGLTFTTPPVSGTTFFCVVFGDMQAVGTPSDGTVLPASISTSGTFVFPNVTVSGTTVIASGTAAAPSLAVSGDLNTGLYSPGADQLAISTNGTQRVTVDTAATTSTLPVVHPLGAVGTPSITFTGDLNTGIWSPAADTVAASTGGTERLRITSAGLVGIGASSPGVILDIRETATGATTAISLFNTDNTNSTSQTARIGLSPDSRGAALTGLEAYKENSDFSTSAARDVSLALNVLLNNAKSEAVRITSAGNVGIGTTGPGRKLAVTDDSGADTALALTCSANTRSFIQYASSATNVYAGNDGGSFVVWPGASEKLRVDTSGRLLVGTSTARSTYLGAGISAGLNVEGAGSLGGSNRAISVVNGYSASTDGGASVYIGRTRSDSIGGTTVVQNGDQLGSVYFVGSDGTSMQAGAQIQAVVDATPGANDMPGRLVFSTTADGASSPTERMRITQAGHIYFAPSGSLSAGSNGTVHYNTGLKESFRAGTASTTHWGFFNDNGQVGSIVTNASATAFNTSSDYRLKENVTTVVDGINRLQQLKPSRFNFIVDPDKTVDGFLAHEVQAVVPEAITGEKDAVDSNGNPIYQGIDQSKLVPLLTAALQEAIGEIESLKARVAALESA